MRILATGKQTKKRPAEIDRSKKPLKNRSFWRRKMRMEAPLFVQLTAAEAPDDGNRTVARPLAYDGKSRRGIIYSRDRNLQNLEKTDILSFLPYKIIH